MLEKWEIVGGTEAEYTGPADQYRPVVECILSDHHKVCMGVDTIWVDIEGLAADDGTE